MSKKRRVKIRVWPLMQIKIAFDEYLSELNLLDSDRWKELTVDERAALCDHHFTIFQRELEKWTPSWYTKEE